MRGLDGVLYPMTGVYQEIAEPERLVFTSAALDAEGRPLFEVLHTVLFAQQGGKTRLTLQGRVLKTTAKAAPYLKGMEAGWTQSLERLAAHVAKPSEESGDREIVIMRVFDAPRELVWEAWTQPEHVVQWWGPRGFTTTIHEIDVRPGGVWRHTMHGPDGTDYPDKSVFIEVVKPERIVYSHGGGKKGGPGAHFQATWAFEVQGDKTKVTLRLLFPSAAARERVIKEYGAIEGGKQTLERLGEHLANTAVRGPSSPMVRVFRSFAAPAEWVFDAWLDPTSIGKWMFGQAVRDEEVLHLKIEPRVGGAFSFLVRRQGTVIDHVGTYREIDRPRRLVFTWGIAGESSDESVVTIEVRPTGTGCELHLTHELDPKWADYVSRTEAGWTKMLNTLAESQTPKINVN